MTPDARPGKDCSYEQNYESLIPKHITVRIRGSHPELNHNQESICPGMVPGKA
jgi:hypothetical protein